MQVQKVTTNVWFDFAVEEAMDYYLSKDRKFHRVFERLVVESGRCIRVSESNERVGGGPVFVAA